MNIYKITFLKNEILSCREAEAKASFDGTEYYEHAEGQMIFAIVKSESFTQATQKALSIRNEVIKEYKSRTVGN